MSIPAHTHPLLNQQLLFSLLFDGLLLNSDTKHHSRHREILYGRLLRLRFYTLVFCCFCFVFLLLLRSLSYRCMLSKSAKVLAKPAIASFSIESVRRQCHCRPCHPQWRSKRRSSKRDRSNVTFVFRVNRTSN